MDILKLAGVLLAYTVPVMQPNGFDVCIQSLNPEALMQHLLTRPQMER